MGFLVFLFVIFLIVVILVVSAGFSFLRGLFSLFGTRKTSSQSRSQGEHLSDDREHNSERNHVKIIKKDEGEYVDYEEVK